MTGKVPLLNYVTGEWDLQPRTLYKILNVLASTLYNEEAMPRKLHTRTVFVEITTL